MADIASCLVNTELGLPTDIENHASYVAFWLQRLKTDKREIFRGAAAAQKAADYCLAFHPDFAGSQSDSDEQDAADGDAPLIEAA
ncbi:hypothetical protein A1351_22470 [Methylosinus sp. R-45379]|uniref:zincin-like metallopeptidase domain-containing protein n=1 Tax=Methylosinus sp. R-45379 TaxID=980563 RepID=UPI0007C9138E|nr:zincin-like metallopeptidase domain-containing protein [Methylosinus sp. R-45379]OAI30625.1 hypothetical protein A1351_22470 [Methylosinus sp. R-45379]